MPTIITHAIVPLALGIAARSKTLAAATIGAGAMLAVLPDADVIGFRLGIAYADAWGHRGASHSIALALAFMALALIAIPAARNLMAATFLFLSAASHGLLDMLTDGGLGVALAWPLDSTRYFFGWTPVRVSPIGSGFFSQRGLETILSEMVWIWLPVVAIVITLRMLPHRNAE